MSASLKSSGGIISLLDEPNQELQCLALTKLDQIVNAFWPEIADVVCKVETLYEDTSFPARKLAALVASKVYYHLGAYEDALMFALGAEELFNVNDHSEYVETIISQAIDQYIALRTHNAESSVEDKKDVDPRLEAIVNEMFDRCITYKHYRQAIGIAIETKRMDVLDRAVKDTDDTSSLLSYCVETTLAVIQNRQYRNEVLRHIVRFYSELPEPDYLNMCQCLIYLEDALSVAEILEKLAKESENSALMAYQIAFDLYESATQQYLDLVLQSLKPQAVVLSEMETTPEIESDMTVDDLKPIASYAEDKKTISLNEAKPESTLPSDAVQSVSQRSTACTSEMPTPPDNKQEDSKAFENITADKEPTLTKCQDLEEQSSKSDVVDYIEERVEKLRAILKGDETISLHLQFLIKNNRTDMLILKNMKDTVRNSVCHTATVIANGLMHAGTTCDDFLRDNLEWVSKATNWSKFTAVASLGVIHNGHEQDAMRILDSYLPKDTSTSSGYMEGGGMFALGLIHANHGCPTVIDYLKTQLQNASTDNVRHGACLGLGLASMGSHRQDIYDQLRYNLYQDDAVTGEAAGIAMGLVMLGSKSANALHDMISYAQDTQHEKIMRGLCVGIAMIMYSRLEEADPIIESLIRDKDPLLRRTGIYSLALAYCGTGNGVAVQRLLHTAVSDVNDDVRRAAVTCLGFLLFRRPDACPTLVSLLTESYNPHVRYGAALALGIACAGTGLKEAISLLELMTNDAVNYVRQGATIALALILIQQNENTCPKVKDFRASLTKTVNDKHEDIMAKFGAFVAQGILDAGGRNVTVSLLTRNGHTSTPTVVGLLLFLQYWYWFPLTHFISLCFQPTCLVGLNIDLKMPKVDFVSNAKPSTYAYPPPLEEKKEKHIEKIETAILSFTAKAKRKEKERAKEREKEKEKEEGKKEKERKENEKENEKEKEEEQAKEKEREKDKENQEEEKIKEKDEMETETEEKESEAEKKLPKELEEDMEVVEEKTAESAEAKAAKDKEVAAKGDAKPPPPEAEPPTQILTNPARVMKQQLKVVSMPENSRYEPLKSITVGGIIMLRDRNHGTPAEFVDLVKGSKGTSSFSHTPASE